MLRNRVIFRADGSSDIGLGHIVRTVALAEMLQDSFHCVLWLRDPGEKVLASLDLKIEYKVIPPFETIAGEIESMQKELRPSDTLVLDGYPFDSSYQLKLKPFIHKLVSIDDLAETYFYSDLVINHGSPEIRKKYRAEPYSKILVGVDYLLLRKPFREAALKSREQITAVDSIFICMGGADPFNASNKVLKAAIKVGFIKNIIIVTGGAYRHQGEMNAILKTVDAEKSVSVHNGVDAVTMVALMQQSHLAVCPASSIALEVASVKCGFLTGMVADNQQAINDMIIESGCAISVGDFNRASENELSAAILQMQDPPLLNRMITKQATFIDGYSGNRLLEEFKSLTDAVLSFR